MGRSIFFFIFLLIFGCRDKMSKNIYDSEKFKNLSEEDILAGEAIWMSTCFRCHMYGSMGAASVSNKPHFDQLAQKGIDQLYNSVLNGFDGKEGVMPPKGSCYSCSNDEIKKSVYYIFHLAKIIQDAKADKKEKKIE